jgi:hypothetical protein
VWEEVPCAFCGAAFDVISLGMMEVSGSAGSIVYVIGKWVAICMGNKSLVGVNLAIITSVIRMVSLVLIIF